jgi:hypothetical protein
MWTDAAIKPDPASPATRRGFLCYELMIFIVFKNKMLEGIDEKMKKRC